MNFNMKKSILTFLGSDAGFGEKNNSAYYETDDSLILIDCGFTVFHEVLKKFDLAKYKNIDIIITHLHNDHAGSLSQLILYLWFVLNKRVRVISKCSRIKEYLDITGTPEEGYELKTELENLEFIKTIHSPGLEAYGFVMTLDNKKIVYTGDTAIIEPFMPYIKNSDELYIDVSKNGGVHIKIVDVLSTLEKIQNEGTNIFLMHTDDREYIRNITKNKFEIE